MTSTEDDNDDGGIVKFSGGPRNSTAPGEAGRWKSFLAIVKKSVWPFAKKAGLWGAAGTDLARQYARAKIAGENNSAAKIAEEAAQLAAATDQKRQETVHLVNEEIGRIMTDEKTPAEAKVLQLAKLLAANPDIEAQIEKVIGIIERLRIVRGAHIEIHVEDSRKTTAESPALTVADSSAALPPPSA